MPKKSVLSPPNIVLTILASQPNTIKKDLKIGPPVFFIAPDIVWETPTIPLSTISEPASRSGKTLSGISSTSPLHSHPEFTQLY